MLRSLMIPLVTLSLCGCVSLKSKPTVNSAGPSGDGALEEIRTNTSEVGVLRSQIDDLNAHLSAKISAEVSAVKAVVNSQSQKTVNGITGTHLTIGWCLYLIVSKGVDILRERRKARKGA